MRKIHFSAQLFRILFVMRSDFVPTIITGGLLNAWRRTWLNHFSHDSNNESISEIEWHKQTASASWRISSEFSSLKKYIKGMLSQRTHTHRKNEFQLKISIEFALTNSSKTSTEILAEISTQISTAFQLKISIEFRSLNPTKNTTKISTENFKWNFNWTFNWKFQLNFNWKIQVKFQLKNSKLKFQLGRFF